MEQRKDIDRSLFTSYKKEKYLKSTVDTIKWIKMVLWLFNDLDDQDFLRIMNSQVNKIIWEVAKLQKIHENPEKIIEMVLKFIENIFKNFDVKLFYNLTPNISYKEYAKKGVGEQIINNIFDGKLSNKNPDKDPNKVQNFIEKEYIKWWNCHHWSILVKKIFDILKIKGLDCQIRRFQQGHSFVMMQYKNKMWMLDMIEYWRVLWLKELNASWSVKSSEIITKVMEPDNSSVLDFSSIGKFAEYTDKENTKGVRLQIDRIKAEIVWDTLKIEITKDKWRKVKKYEIKLNRITKTYNKKDFITKIMPRVQRALIIVGKKLPAWYMSDNNL